MLYACVQRFDVTGNLLFFSQNILELNKPLDGGGGAINSRWSQRGASSSPDFNLLTLAAFAIFALFYSASRDLSVCLEFSWSIVVLVCGDGSCEADGEASGRFGVGGEAGG
jgi:hypothetical protein